MNCRKTWHKHPWDTLIGRQLIEIAISNWPSRINICCLSNCSNRCFFWFCFKCMSNSEIESQYLLWDHKISLTEKPLFNSYIHSRIYGKHFEKFILEKTTNLWTKKWNWNNSFAFEIEFHFCLIPRQFRSRQNKYCCQFNDNEKDKLM